jgi:hypothetical protein
MFLANIAGLASQYFLLYLGMHYNIWQMPSSPSSYVQELFGPILDLQTGPFKSLEDLSSWIESAALQVTEK